MSEYVKYASTAGDQYLSTLSEMQEAFFKSLTPFNQMVSTLPKPPVAGFASELPTMAEFAEANFAFANKFLKQQKKFADKLFATSSPEVS
jgi:hypothetical protein